MATSQKPRKHLDAMRRVLAEGLPLERQQKAMEYLRQQAKRPELNQWAPGQGCAYAGGPNPYTENWGHV